MSSFEPRGTGESAAPFVPLSGPSIENSSAKSSSVFAELVERSQRVLGEPDEDVGDDILGEALDAEALAAEREAAALALASLEAELHASYERGLREGREALEAEYGLVAKGFADALADLAQSRGEARKRHHRALVDVAFKAARKIVGEELELSPARWLAMIRDGVHRTLDRETIVVRVGSSLHHYLTAHLDELRGQLEEVRDLELAEDPGLPPTGCVVETAYGDLDLSAESQLGVLQATLNEPK